MDGARLRTPAFDDPSPTSTPTTSLPPPRAPSRPHDALHPFHPPLARRNPPPRASPRPPRVHRRARTSARAVASLETPPPASSPSRARVRATASVLSRASARRAPRRARASAGRRARAPPRESRHIRARGRVAAGHASSGRREARRTDVSVVSPGERDASNVARWTTGRENSCRENSQRQTYLVV